MRVSDGALLLSPSDLSAHLACPHLTTLSLRAARGEIVKPVLDSPHRDLIFRKGNEHEAAYLARLVADERSIAHIPTYDEEAFDAVEAQRLTEGAIRSGLADVIYQPYLVSEDGRWRGFADFLERQADGGYEPVDTKLARRAKPAHVLQLLFYAEQLERIAGRPAERVHVENGLGERETFRVVEFAAYYRRVRERFLDALEAREETYGWPCDHCSICDFRHVCWEQRVDDDHLTLVAGMRRAQAETLIAAGVSTLEELGELVPGTAIEDLTPESLAGIRHQAELQLRGRREGRYLFELLPDQAERGFHLLPAPDAGDVWFDMEGHPFYETSRGLEYLFGYCFRDDAGEVVYEAVWGRDRDGERAAFEQFVDWVVERRRRYPRLHVYHYASYERSALTRLMGQHGTREREVDDFLRQEVLVDLYRIVKQSLRASTDSYSIKAIEKLYDFERTADVSGGDESIVRFEEWVETGDDAILEEVERYNEEDCRSTFELHEWLRSIRPGVIPWRLPPEERERSEALEERDRERAALKARLLAGAEEGEPRRLLANLIDYHQRDQRPEWWAWFRWPQLDDAELFRDRTAIGGLVWDGKPPEVEDQSHAYRMTFPPEQEHKIEGEGFDPRTRARFRVRVDDDNCVVTILRSVNRVDEPLPEGLTPGQPVPNGVLRDALLRFARAYADGNETAYPALVALLERRPPNVRLDADPVTAALTLGLSYLFVQGPPGSGKTWQGAQMAIALMRGGKRVGVTSLSHKAIINLLRAIQREADKQGFTFSGVKKAGDGDPEESFTDRCFVTSSAADVCADPSFDLVAGTAWALTREAVDAHVAERPIDVLFVDEAGQLSLADVLAAGTSARSLVLLGDPNQLPQVSQGLHPEGSGLSGLQHLLGDDVTIPPDRGLFLAKTYRLRPELCAFTSDAYYEGRLEPAPVTARRSLVAGNGPVWRAVPHEHRGQSSKEEADAVERAVEALVGTPFTDENGVTRPLTENDVLVVAPYNAQVRLLRSQLPAAVRVGTVDKFQGQEAPVVVVSMASSTAEEAPRGVGFAFNRHRFNVATSRAQCRAVLACSPALLDADCRTVEQMRLVSAVCWFVELASME